MALTPPVTTSISVSSPTCPCSGVPAFTASYTHQNIGTQSISALVRRWSHYCNGFIANHPQKGSRRRGLPPTMLSDEWDEVALDLEDTELVNLDPGQTMSRSDTFSAVAKLDGFVSSDMCKLEVGKKYTLRLMRQRWRWKFASDIPVHIHTDHGLIGRFACKIAKEMGMH